MTRLLSIALACVLLAAPLSAHEYVAGSLTIDHPVLREMPPGARVAAGYLTVVNAGDTADRLIGIETDAALRVELHRSVVSDGIARMLPLEVGLELPPGASVVLGADGTHAMFINPVSRFTAGQSLDAVLIFEVAGRVPVSFKVEKIAAGDGEHAH